MILNTEEGESIFLTGRSLSVMGGGSKTKDFSLVKIRTASQKYAWLNRIVCVREAEVSPDFTSFNGALYEWE